MKPDDARHGTYAGAVQHWLNSEKACDPCARAGSRYRQERILRALSGNAATVPAVGSLRRIQALHALGWTGPQIAEAADISINTMRSIGYHDSGTVRTTTAAKIDAAYERLAMVRPEGKYADRARRMARRRGWAPPLAFDNIDDPSERPDDAGYRPVKNRENAEMAAEIDHLLGLGVSLHHAAKQLGVSVEAVEKAIEKAADRAKGSAA